MINVNDINPQMIQALIDRIDVLEKMIYDLDGKAIRAKTINGDRITGGIIEGTLIKTANTTDYIYMHDQYLDFFNGDDEMFQLGFVDFLGTKIPCLYAAANGFTIGSTGLTKIEGDSVIFQANSVKVNNNSTIDEVATKDWVASYVASHSYTPPTP